MKCVYLELSNRIMESSVEYHTLSTRFCEYKHAQCQIKCCVSLFVARNDTLADTFPTSTMLLPMPTSTMLLSMPTSTMILMTSLMVGRHVPGVDDYDDDVDDDGDDAAADDDDDVADG